MTTLFCDSREHSPLFILDDIWQADIIMVLECFDMDSRSMRRQGSEISLRDIASEGGRGSKPSLLCSEGVGIVFTVDESGSLAHFRRSLKVNMRPNSDTNSSVWLLASGCQAQGLESGSKSLNSARWQMTE